MPAREVKIIKIPLSDKERTQDYPIKFPRMPRMYLELLENKSKIKQDLINKEYVPKNVDMSIHADKNIDKNKNETKIKSDKSDKLNDIEINTTSENVSISEKSKSISEKSDSEKSKTDSSGSNSEKESENSSLEVSSREVSSKEDSYDEKSDNDEDDLSERLKELLGETNSELEKKSGKKSKSISSVHSSISNKTSRYMPYEMYKEKQNTKPVPTLAELEQKGQYQHKPELRDISHIPTSEYDEEDKKRELLFKFDLLKKSYPNSSITIPEYNVFSNLHEMQKTYETTLKRLSLDSTVESYKTYLISGFMLVEYIFGNFLGFDMQGFTQQQIVNMHSYEKILIELGEKSYVPTGSKWPVELRLLFIIIMNAGIFIVGKMIMRKTGANLIGMMNSVNTHHTTANHNITPQPENRQKRRMKGPNINLDNLPDVNNTNNANNSNNANNVNNSNNANTNNN